MRGRWISAFAVLSLALRRVFATPRHPARTASDAPLAANARRLLEEGRHFDRGFGHRALQLEVSDLLAGLFAAQGGLAELLKLFDLLKLTKGRTRQTKRGENGDQYTLSKFHTNCLLTQKELHELIFSKG